MLGRYELSNHPVGTVLIDTGLNIAFSHIICRIIMSSGSGNASPSSPLRPPPSILSRSLSSLNASKETTVVRDEKHPHEENTNVGTNDDNHNGNPIINNNTTDNDSSNDTTSTNNNSSKIGSMNDSNNNSNDALEIQKRANALFLDAEILAPMVRANTTPLRLLALSYGADLVFTEEIIDRSILTCDRYVNESLGTVDYVRKMEGFSAKVKRRWQKEQLVGGGGVRNNDSGDKIVEPLRGPVVLRIVPSIEGGKLIYQMGTADPELAVRAAKFVERDVDGIDVNMGCPKPFSGEKTILSYVCHYTFVQCLPFTICLTLGKEGYGIVFSEYCSYLTMMGQPLLLNLV